MSKLPFKEFEVTKVEQFYEQKGITQTQFKFSTVSEDIILKSLLGLNISKATGNDNVPARYLWDVANEIVTPIKYLINLSLKTKQIPSDFNVARVVPLYKKGDRNYEGNYRHVSILPVASKILERVFYDQINSYLLANNVFYTFQSGFRSKFSTETCLTHLTDLIRFNMDKGLFIGIVLIDLQNTFEPLITAYYYRNLKLLVYIMMFQLGSNLILTTGNSLVTWGYSFKILWYKVLCSSGADTWPFVIFIVRQWYVKRRWMWSIFVCRWLSAAGIR